MTAAEADALATLVAAVDGVRALHPPRPIPTRVPGRQPALPTVHRREDHVAIAVGLAVETDRGAVVARDVAAVARTWAQGAHPDLPSRITVRVVAIER